MSQDGAGPKVRLLEGPTFARISSGATGWPMLAPTYGELLAIPWDYLSITGAGLCGVISKIDGDVLAQALAAHTARRSELDTVEIREDVAVVELQGPRGPTQQKVLGTLESMSSGAGGRPLASFVAAQSMVWVFQGWRRAGIETALASTTSLSG